MQSHSLIFLLYICLNRFLWSQLTNKIMSKQQIRLDYIFPPSFNPNDVDIRLQYISVSQLISMIEAGKLSIWMEAKLHGRLLMACSELAHCISFFKTNLL